MNNEDIKNASLSKLIELMIQKSSAASKSKDLTVISLRDDVPMQIPSHSKYDPKVIEYEAIKEEIDRREKKYSKR